MDNMNGENDLMKRGSKCDNEKIYLNSNLEKIHRNMEINVVVVLD